MNGTNTLPGDPLIVHPVGIVHSPVRSRREMPRQGVPGAIEIFPAYADALDGIGKNSHIFVLCWMHEADRTVCTAVPRKICSDLPAKGCSRFGPPHDRTRSPCAWSDWSE